ncbi:MAG: histidine phosphatase family protein [Hyphomicrobiales bacterium]|nr:histidine phosphatase family protein [Hyphomicrobiales bacterium]
MRRLILLRHAKAAREAGGGDRERPLVKRGREDAHRLGAWLLAQHYIPNLAVVSDARRTRETLENLTASMQRSFKTLIDPSLYLAEDVALIGEMHKTPDVVHTMLVVAHNPGIAEFSMRICGSGDLAARQRMDVKFPTCACAVVAFDDKPWSRISWGEGRLDHFVTPSTLHDGLDDAD